MNTTHEVDRPDSNDVLPEGSYTWSDATKYVRAISAWLTIEDDPMFGQLKWLARRCLDYFGNEEQPEPVTDLPFDDPKQLIEWAHDNL